MCVCVCVFVCVVCIYVYMYTQTYTQKIEYIYKCLTFFPETSPNDVMYITSVNGLEVLGSHLGNGSNLEHVFKRPNEKMSSHYTFSTINN